jgi:hypothetical protein
MTCKILSQSRNFQAERLLAFDRRRGGGNGERSARLSWPPAVWLWRASEPWCRCFQEFHFTVISVVKRSCSFNHVARAGHTYWHVEAWRSSINDPRVPLICARSPR